MRRFIVATTILSMVLLFHVIGATKVHRRNVQVSEASPKYDTGGSYGSSGYGGGGSSYGGGGYGGGGGSYGGGGGSYGGGGGSYGGGGGGYGGAPGGYSKEGGGGGGDGNVGERDSGGGDGGGGGGYDTGNVYYYYYPTGASSSASSSYNSYQPPTAYYYPMQMYDDKDKEEGLLGGLLGLGIPAILAVVLGIPLLLLGLLAAGAAIAFFVGRSSDGGFPIGGLPGDLTDLSLIRAVHEAFAAYQALSTDEGCRQRVVCELGYIFKASESKGTIISVLDAMLPNSFQRHFKPLKEVLMSSESGKCQKYICDAAAAALKDGPLSTILGTTGQKGTTTTKTPDPGSDSDAQHSPPNANQKKEPK